MALAARGTGKYGCYHVVLSYEVEEAGLYAAQAAIRIAEALTKGSAYDLQRDIEQLTLIAEDKKSGSGTAYM